MSVPTLSDYAEAVQNPRAAFADPVLQGARVQTTPLGLPRAISGNTAIVFRMSAGTETWAVRCFQRLVADQRDRYAAISAHLRGVSLPCFVGFEFQEQGIRSRGGWYPLLKMQWVEGEPLDRFVARSLSDPSALLEAARRWSDLMKVLQESGIAHGDLQHGNVLVHDGNFMLIDYDGMFVPSLNGRVSAELGHRNYQHPRRTEQDFGPNVDRFSAWVIWLSLVALARQPDLWTALRGGDECLLFRAADFANPYVSDAFNRIAQADSGELPALADRLINGALGAPSEVPALEGEVPQVARTVHWTRTGGLPDWIRERRDGTQPPEPVEPDSGSFGEHLGSAAAWALPPAPAAVAFPRSPTSMLAAVRLWLIAVTGGAAWATYGTAGAPAVGVCTVALVLCTLVLLMSRFRASPLVAAAQEAREALSRAQGEVGGAEGNLRAAESERSKLRESHQAEQEKLAKDLRAAADQEHKMTGKARAACEQAVARLRAQQVEIRAKATAEKARQLDALHGQLTERAVSAHRVADAQLPGIGPGIVRNLAVAGVYSAHDIVRAHGNDLVLRSGAVVHVAGIGEARAARLQQWADGIRATVRAMPPSTLPGTVVEGIDRAAESSCQNLDQQIRMREHRLLQELATIGQTAADCRTVIQKRQRTLLTDMRTKDRAAVGDVERRRQEVSAARWAEARAAQRAAAYTNIRFSAYIGSIVGGPRGPAQP